MPDYLIWGQSFNNTHINKIQTLQNNALRIITFCPDFRDHVTPKLRRAIGNHCHGHIQTLDKQVASLVCYQNLEF